MIMTNTRGLDRNGLNPVTVRAGTMTVMKSSDGFLSAVGTAESIRRVLDEGNIEAADRLLTEAISRILLASAGSAIPESILDPPQSTGSPEFDTLLATALAFALLKRGEAPRPWMLEVPALPAEWVWDGGYGVSLQFKDFIKRHTPPIFLAKNILLRERDLVAP
jgi:hypothetical protein